MRRQKVISLGLVRVLVRDPPQTASPDPPASARLRSVQAGLNLRLVVARFRFPRPRDSVLARSGRTAQNRPRILFPSTRRFLRPVRASLFPKPNSRRRLARLSAGPNRKILAWRFCRELGSRGSALSALDGIRAIPAKKASVISAAGVALAWPK